MCIINPDSFNEPHGLCLIPLIKHQQLSYHHPMLWWASHGGIAPATCNDIACPAPL